MKYLLFAMCAAACAGMAEARIGDTPAECDARYGEAAEDAKAVSRRDYNVGAFVVRCWFREGKCEAVSYTPWIDSITMKTIWEPLTALQMMRLLHIHGKDWTPEEGEESDGDLQGDYRKKDGTLYARISLSMVSIETAERRTRGEAAMTKEAIDADISALAK